MFQALRERGITGFGANRDQNSEAPDHVLASAVIDIPGAFVTMAREVKEGRFVPQMHRLGLREGIVSLVINPRLSARITPELAAKLQGIEAGIRAGAVVVPRGF